MSLIERGLGTCELTSRFCSSIRRISVSSPWCRSCAERKVSATNARAAQYCSTFVRGAAAPGAENHVPPLCGIADALPESSPREVAETFILLTASCMVRDMAVVVDAFAAGAIGDASPSRGCQPALEGATKANLHGMNQATLSPRSPHVGAKTGTAGCPHGQKR